jgi:hypothetical protein
MTSFKRFETKPMVKIIYTYTHCNLWLHRQFITIFYQFLHIRIEIIHGSHMYILFLQRVCLYVSFLPLAYARGKTSWHKGLPVVKTIYTYGFHELFLKLIGFHTMFDVSFCPLTITQLMLSKTCYIFGFLIFLELLDTNPFVYHCISITFQQ